MSDWLYRNGARNAWVVTALVLFALSLVLVAMIAERGC